MLDQQLAELMDDEGLRLLVYDDATGQPIKKGSYVQGHPTIGFGRALDVHGISRDEAGYLLANDVFVVEAELKKCPWFVALDPVRRGVCANLAFNMGVRGLLSFVRMIGALQRLDFDGAATELASSRWAHQVQGPRSRRLVRQLRTGILLEAAATSPVPLPPDVLPPVPGPASAPAADTVDEDKIADALNQAELDRLHGNGQ